MNTPRILPALGLLAALTPLATAAPEWHKVADEQIIKLSNELATRAKQLRPAVAEQRVIRKGNTHLTVSSTDPNLKSRVDSFNTSMDAFLGALARKYPTIERGLLEQMVLGTSFGKLLTSGPPQPPTQEAQRWMIHSTHAVVYQDESGSETAENEIALPLAIYYAAKDASGSRIELFKTVELDQSSRLGWVEESALTKWDHNMVFQLTNPMQRRIQLGDSDPEFTPNPLFFEDSGSAISLFLRMEDEGKDSIQDEVYNYQQATEAVDGMQGDVSAASSFQESHKVGYTLGAETYRDGNIFFPIVDVGARGDDMDDPGETFKNPMGQRVSLPYQVRFLSMDDAPRPRKAREVLTEIYFVMDLTGSMEPFVDGLKTALTNEFNKLDAAQKSHFRLGFVGYRDIPKVDGKELKAFKFHDRTDGNGDSPIYDYTHAGMLGPDEFLTLLEQVKSPRKELEALGLSEADIKRQMRLVQDEDTPEQLYQALNSVTNTNPNWTYGGDKQVFRFVVVLGDAPDKSANYTSIKERARAAQASIDQATGIRQQASESTTALNISSIYLYNTEIKSKKNQSLRDTGKEQFAALSTIRDGETSFKVKTSDKGVELENASPVDMFTNALHFLIEGTTMCISGDTPPTGWAQSPPTNAPADTSISSEDAEEMQNMQKLMMQSKYLFSNAVFSTNDNKVLNKSLSSSQPKNGIQEYWVTEYDPLLMSTGTKDPAKTKVFEPYVLMTPHQLNEWCRIAMTIVELIENNSEDHDSIRRTMAELFGLAAGDFDSGAEVLNRKILEKLPYRSLFLKEYLESGGSFGSQEEHNAFAEKFKSFTKKLAALQDMKKRLGQDAEAKSVIMNPTDPDSTTTVPEDKQLYRIPLYLLP